MNADKLCPTCGAAPYAPCVQWDMQTPLDSLAVLQRPDSPEAWTKHGTRALGGHGAYCPCKSCQSYAPYNDQRRRDAWRRIGQVPPMAGWPNT